MQITERQKQIMTILIEEHIRTGLPVSSGFISNKLNSVSSATIRNEMMILETLKLIEKQSNVSGRKPTSSGYKYYVDNIMPKDTKLMDIKNKLNTVLNDRVKSIDEIMDISCNIISNMLNIVTLNNIINVKARLLKKIDLIELSNSMCTMIIVLDDGSIYNNQFINESLFEINELQRCVSFFNRYLINTKINDIYAKLESLKKIGKKFILEHEETIQKLVKIIIANIKPHHTISGLENIINRDEYHDYEKFNKLVKLLNQKSVWKLLESKSNSSNISLSIGKDISQDLKDIAAITKKYNLKSGQKGQLVFVGPQRLNYSNLYGLLNWFIKKIESL